MSLRIVFRDLVIYEDDNVLAINKPPHISSLHERFDSSQLSIVGLAKKENAEYSLCHRIDRETSGVMLISKNADTYRHIAMQFEKRQVEKVYHAVVSASVNIQGLKVDLPLYTDSKRRVQVSKKSGKESLTEFNTIRQYKHFSILACKPFTGRLHQIRIHAASQNLPLVCDDLYGGKVPYLSDIKRKVKSEMVSRDGTEEKRSLINRVALHAFSIRFDSPGKGTTYIEAPYPKDFEVLVKLLEKYDQQDK
jgi:23S rRNA pseudouridine955/2504/2580 synthase